MEELSQNTNDQVQFLTFTVGNEEYGIDIMKIREIKGWTQSTRLPNSPTYMCGVINLRGAIIPIFDLRARFEMGNTEADQKNVIIILSVGERIIGILVDTVSDILNALSSAIKPAPNMDIDVHKQFIEGLISHEERMVVLLDIDKLFDDQIIESSFDATTEKNN